MDIKGKVAVITGAASGIGHAAALDLVKRGAQAVAMVDITEQVHAGAEEANAAAGRAVAYPYQGDVTDPAFRRAVFDDMESRHGPVRICIPAAGITLDALSVRLDKETGKAQVYDVDTFQLVVNVNLVAPTYWALEMVARIAEDRFAKGVKKWTPGEGIMGVVIFIGSVSSQGNKGQLSYAATKSGLEGVAATLMKEAIFHGVRCGVLHPGFTDTPMVRALGEEYIEKYVLPDTQLGRLIRPDEISDAICFMISNSAVTGELWADAGWHPNA
jgi:3-oxoacyl-[acyl-carrier protein] reductase